MDGTEGSGGMVADTGASRSRGAAAGEPPPRIVVTGSTGRLGGRVARGLSAAGIGQRLLVRDPARAPRLPGAVAVRAEYSEADAVRSALEGAEVVLMVSASESRDRVDRHRAFVDAAAAAGVGHLVYTSFYGAAPDATFTLARDHWWTEQHIRHSGLPFTFLRDNLYLDFLPEMVGEDGMIRGPAGDGRVAAVAQDDIADVITAILADPTPHAERTYDLTGPESFTLAEAARTISEITGRDAAYHAETIEEAYASRARYDAPRWQVDAWVSTYTAIAAGEMAAVSDAVPLLAGHPATSLADLLRGDG